MAKVFTVIPRIAGGDFYDVRPPIDQDWEVEDIGSDVIVGIALDSVPNAVAGICNIAGVSAPMRRSSVAAPSTRGWANPSKWHINNSNWLRIDNPEAGNLNIGIVVKLAKYTGNLINSSVVSGTAFVSAGLTTIIRPPLGQDWVITDIGSNIWTAGAGGRPNVTIELFDGTNGAMLARNADLRGWDRPFEIHINNATYVRLTNTGADATLGWSGAITHRYTPNIIFSNVISRVLPIPANAWLIPPAGEEWVITDIGCDLWSILGGGIDLPNIVVQLNDGARTVVVQMFGIDKGWQGSMAYCITNTNVMLFTAVAPGFIAISGHRWRE